MPCKTSMVCPPLAFSSFDEPQARLVCSRIAKEILEATKHERDSNAVSTECTFAVRSTLREVLFNVRWALHEGFAGDDPQQ